MSDTEAAKWATDSDTATLIPNTNSGSLEGSSSKGHKDHLVQRQRRGCSIHWQGREGQWSADQGGAERALGATQSPGFRQPSPNMHRHVSSSLLLNVFSWFPTLLIYRCTLFRVDKMLREESHPRMLRRLVTRNHTENIVLVCKCEAYILLLIKQMMTHFASKQTFKYQGASVWVHSPRQQEFDPNDLGYIEVCVCPSEASPSRQAMSHQ